MARSVWSRKREASLSTILFRVADPVQSFSFEFLLNCAELSLPAGICNGLRKHPNLSKQLNKAQTDEFKCFHDDFLVPAGRRGSRR